MFNDGYGFSPVRNSYSPVIGWAYQDFTAGEINSTSLTITTNPYVTLDNTKIINNSVFIIKQTAQDNFVYSGVSKLFSSLIKSTGNTAQVVTLNAVPNNFWGNVRVWYRYTYVNGIPANYEEAPAFIRDSLLGTVKDLITPEEIGAINKTPLITTKANTDSPYSIQSTDDIILANTTNGVVTLTLPATGRFKVKWISGTNTLTVNVSDSGTIDGASSCIFNTVKDCIEFVAVTSGVYYII